MLVESLAENFNETDRTFNLRGHLVPISNWDVYCILGLFDKREKIGISRKHATTLDLDITIRSKTHFTAGF